MKATRWMHETWHSLAPKSTPQTAIIQATILADISNNLDLLRQTMERIDEHLGQIAYTTEHLRKS